MKRIHKHNDIAYTVLREKAVFAFSKKFEDEPDLTLVHDYMKWLGADHVLRTPTHFLFCETIPDVDFEIVE